MVEADNQFNTRWPPVEQALQTLPGADPARVRWWLDRVAAEKSVTIKRLVAKHVEQAQRCRQWIADLPDMKFVANPEECRIWWRVWAEHEEREAHYWRQFRGVLPYRRIPQLRIIGVWWNCRGGLEPAQAWPFYAAAHMYVFGKPAPQGDARAFERLLQEFRETVVEDFKRKPVRLISIFGTEVR